MTAEPAPHPTRSDWLAQRLRDEIRSGRLRGGTHLRQTEIARRFGVSSTPVREAFALLQLQGLLVRMPFKGVVVSTTTLEDLRENYEIRIQLEALATRLAVPNLSDDDLEELRRLLDELAPLSFDESEWLRYFELNEAFHDRIYAAAGRPRLLALIVQLRGEPASFLRQFENARKLNPRETERQHEEIYAACLARDPDRAATAMADHLQRTVDLIAGR